MKLQVCCLLAILVLEKFTASSQAIQPWWPVKGTVMLGGGHLSDSTSTGFEKRFVAIAGGANAVIIVIPTANPKFSVIDAANIKLKFKAQGARQVIILDIHNHNMANSDSIIKLFRSATGVFITGGQVMVLEKIYRGTGVETELKALVARGGVVAGDSAGAIAIGSLWLSWLPDPYGKRTDDLGILPTVTVSPHADAARGFVMDNEVLKYLIDHKNLTGIDIDENTMLILDNQRAVVIGSGNVSVLNAGKSQTGAFLKLSAGAPYNLSR